MSSNGVADNVEVGGSKSVLLDNVWFRQPPPDYLREFTYSFNDRVIPSDGQRERDLGASLDAHKRGLVREAMDAWEKVCGVRFVERADSEASMVRIGWEDPSMSDGPGGPRAGSARLISPQRVSSTESCSCSTLPKARRGTTTRISTM